MTFAGNPKYDDYAVIGFVENVVVNTDEGEKIIPARIDTGATKSSIDASIVEELDKGPVVGERVIRNAHGSERRKIVRMKIKIEGKTVNAKFTIANRSQLKYPMLIGRNILKKKFLIDPNKKKGQKPKDQKELYDYKHQEYDSKKEEGSS